jgi:Zn-dependent metalloprotease
MALKKLICIGLLLLSLAGPGAGRAASPGRLEALLRQQSGGAARVAYHAGTGRVRFVGLAAGRPLRLGTGLEPGVSAAWRFVEAYGGWFGVEAPDRELRVKRAWQAEGGRYLVRFQQVYRGVAVLGGELNVQMDAEGNVLSANGELLPGLDLAVQPAVSAAQAQAIAVALAARLYDQPGEALEAGEATLWVYDPRLLGGPEPERSQLVWQVRVHSRGAPGLQELVWVEAQQGGVALHFNQLEGARVRAIYDNANEPSYGLPGPDLVRVEGQGATGNTEVDRAYDYAGAVYDYYWNTYGRDSIDGAGAPISVTVRYCDPLQPCPYAGAFWNGAQAAVGQGWAVDDIVAHELTHGVTEHEAGLFPYMQSGAIGESLADLGGELVDRADGLGNDDLSVRWLMGEDLAGGALRSLSDPTLYGQPDRMGSPAYACGTADNGGIHTNSGVNNKAAYLLGQVGEVTFNNVTVAGLGLGKTARIYYEAQNNLLTSASDYQDLAELLPQACVNLINTGFTTPADCAQVQQAVQAVEMAAQPANCAATEAALCPAGQAPRDLWADDMEDPMSGKWTFSAADRWHYLAETYAQGQYSLHGLDFVPAGVTWAAMTSDVGLPAGSTPYLHFKHAYVFEAPAADGGLLEYSTDGGATWLASEALPTLNGYNGSLAAGNPLQGRGAFVDHSNGFESTRLNLASLAGSSVRWRWVIGANGTGDARLGWYIDDVRLYTCVARQLSYLPLAVRSAPWILPPATPRAGTWEGPGGGFVVSGAPSQVSNFTAEIVVTGCGSYTITYPGPVAVINGQFTFSGMFYGTGVFDNQATARGTAGLAGYNLPGCGAVTMGPWSWQASWQY